MEFKSNAGIHGEDCEKPRIKEEPFNPDEIVTESQTARVQENEKLFVNCVQISDVDTKVEVKQETWDPNLASSDVKSSPNQSPTYLGTVAVKGDDDIDIKEEQIIQYEVSPESEGHETYFMEYNVSSAVEAKVEVKQEAWNVNGVSSDIKCDPGQPTTLGHVPSLGIGPIKAEYETDIKETLWSCEETSIQSLNERKESGSKKNVTAEDVLLLELSRPEDAVLSFSAIQLQENKNTSSFSENSNTTAQKCEIKHKCNTCGKWFKLLSHLKEHNLDPSKCKWRNGDKNYTYSGVLKDHVTHNNRSQHLCAICGKTFSNLRNFKAHLLVHGDRKQYKCQICNKSFNRVDHLKSHLLVHDDKRQFQCEVCAKCFKRLEYLKSHLLTHEEKRQYKCHICEKSFKQLQGLNNHLLVHDDKRRYKCHICGKKFQAVTHFENTSPGS